MMFRKGLLAMLAVSVLCCVISCGKKAPEEEVIEVDEVEVDVPAVVPGEAVLIPAGEFIMGVKDKIDPNSKKPSNAYPEHKVKLPAYWIDKYEVTNLEYMEFSVKTGYVGEGAKQGFDWRKYFSAGKENVPVVYITTKDAEEYCKAQGKRLPTEEEWEKAARGANGNIYPWGNEWQDGMANTYEAGHRAAVDIGQSAGDVSPFGVHDMLGNVQEWTASKYAAYKGGPAVDAQTAAKNLRVVRGLSYNHRAKKGTLMNRDAQSTTVMYDFGFRCAKDATPEDTAKAGAAQ